MYKLRQCRQAKPVHGKNQRKKHLVTDLRKPQPEGTSQTQFSKQPLSSFDQWMRVDYLFSSLLLLIAWMVARCSAWLCRRSAVELMLPRGPPRPGYPLLAEEAMAPLRLMLPECCTAGLSGLIYPALCLGSRWHSAGLISMRRGAHWLCSSPLVRVRAGECTAVPGR